MRLYTSRWANRDLGKLDVQAVAISRGVPRWRLPFRYRRLWELCPTREEFGLDGDEFDRAYTARLDEMGVEAIRDLLGDLSGEAGGKPLVLLCHENVLKGEACHRRTFAEWWHGKTGEEVPELERGMLGEAPRQDRLW